MVSIIALVIASVTACGTIMKEINICLNGNSYQINQNNVQQVMVQNDHNGLDDFIAKQLEQRESDTEIDIKINVHNVSHAEMIKEEER